MNSSGRSLQVLRYVWQHPANRRRRLLGVTRAVTFQARGRLGLRTQATVGKRGRMWVELHSHAAAKALYANPPDWNEMLAWRRILRPGDLFIDVGSNVGTYTLWAADAGAQVVAIEPSAAAATRLRENVALSGFPVEIQQCAVADRPGWLRLTGDRGTGNHLLPAAAPRGEEVTVTTLDHILGERSAVGVKIDVEGAERLVLAGAERALASHRIGVLQLEWNGASQQLLSESREPVKALLTSFGYTLMRPDQRGQLHPEPRAEISGDDMFAVAPALTHS